MSNQTPSGLIQQGDQCFYQGDYQGAVVRLEEAAALAHAQGENGWELYALDSLAVAWGNVGNYQKMLEVATQLLARTRQLQREDYQMWAALRLTSALANLDLRGRWREIKPLLLAGLATARHLGDYDSEVYHLRKLGECAVKMGEAEQGLAWLQEALNTVRPDKSSYQDELFLIYSDLSELMRKRGEYGEAVRYAEMAVGAARTGGNPNFVASAQLTLAEAERARGERGEALRLAEAVLAQARQMRWKNLEQEAEYLRGELERELGHPELAEAAARQALKLAQESKQKEEEVKCLLSLGQTLVALKRLDEACEVLKQARRLSQERDYEDHFSKAEELLQSLSNGGKEL